MGLFVHLMQNSGPFPAQGSKPPNLGLSTAGLGWDENRHLVGNPLTANKIIMAGWGQKTIPFTANRDQLQTLIGRAIPSGNLRPNPIQHGDGGIFNFDWKWPLSAIPERKW